MYDKGGSNSLFLAAENFFNSNKITSITNETSTERPMFSLRKHSTFRDAIPDFPAKWHLRNERRNSIPMTRHYPDLGSASEWLKIHPIRTTTCLVPVRRFPSPSRSIRLGDVFEANGRETPRQKQNAHACVTFWNSKMTLMLWAASKQAAGDFGY